MGGNAQQQAAGEIQRSQAQVQQFYSGYAIPQLQQAFGLISGDLGDGMSGSAKVNEAFDTAEKSFDTGINQQKLVSKQMIGQASRTSGAPMTSGSLDSALANAYRSLERDRDQGMRNLKFQRSQADLGEFNALTTAMSGGINTAMQGAMGNTQNALQAASMMNQGGGLYGALGGAASGAATGASIPGAGATGAVAGGLVGGILGYMG